MLANSMSTKSLYPEYYVKGTDNSVRRQLMSVFNKKIWIVTSWTKTEEMRRLPVAREMQAKGDDAPPHPGPELLGRKVAQHLQEGLAGLKATGAVGEAQQGHPGSHPGGWETLVRTKTWVPAFTAAWSQRATSCSSLHAITW